MVFDLMIPHVLHIASVILNIPTLRCDAMLLLLPRTFLPPRLRQSLIDIPPSYKWKMSSILWDLRCAACIYMLTLQKPWAWSWARASKTYVCHSLGCEFQFIDRWRR